MPGKIIKVLVKVQAPVEVGTPLIVMEAMKMEYSLKSDVNGIVAEIRCREGEQVALGQFLARVEGSKDEK